MSAAEDFFKEANDLIESLSKKLDDMGPDEQARNVPVLQFHISIAQAYALMALTARMIEGDES